MHSYKVRTRDVMLLHLKAHVTNVIHEERKLTRIVDTKETKNLHEKILILYRTSIFERPETKTRWGPIDR